MECDEKYAPHYSMIVLRYKSILYIVLKTENCTPIPGASGMRPDG